VCGTLLKVVSERCLARSTFRAALRRPKVVRSHLSYPTAAVRIRYVTHDRHVFVDRIDDGPRGRRNADGPAGPDGVGHAAVRAAVRVPSVADRVGHAATGAGGRAARRRHRSSVERVRLASRRRDREDLRGQTSRLRRRSRPRSRLTLLLAASATKTFI